MILNFNDFLNENFIIPQNENFDNWIIPDIEKQKLEYKIEEVMKGNHYFDSEEHFLNSVKNGEIISITKYDDRNIRYRSHTDTYEELFSMIQGFRSYPEFRNENTLKNLYKRIQNNEELDLPIVIQFEDGGRRVFCGNTRLDVCFQMGVKYPKVLLIKNYVNESLNFSFENLVNKSPYFDEYEEDDETYEHYRSYYQEYDEEDNDKFISFVDKLNIPLSDFILSRNSFSNKGTLCHGMDHTYRVMYNVLKIGYKLNNIIDTKRAFCAAYIHDMSRRTDGTCHIHGSLSVVEQIPKFESLFKKLNMNNDDFESIKLAVTNHSELTEVESNNPYYKTVSILRDADALDLARLDRKVKPSFLRNSVSKDLIRNSKELFFNTVFKNYKNFEEFFKSNI